MLPTPVSRLIAVLSVIFGVTAFVLLLMPKPAVSSFEMEIAKALLQLGVVSVVGVVVSVLVFEYQRARNNSDKERDLECRRLEYREDLLKSTLSRIELDSGLFTVRAATLPKEMGHAARQSGVRASPVEIRLGGGVGPSLVMRPQSPSVPPRILRQSQAFMLGGDASGS